MFKNNRFRGAVTGVYAFGVLLMVFLATNGFADPPQVTDGDVFLYDPNLVMIDLGAYTEDDGEPNVPGEIAYTVTALPLHGQLYEPALGDPNELLEILTVPTTLLNSEGTVYYQPCAYYFLGQDDFTFVADDGGIAPENGLSETATITLHVDMSSVIEYPDPPIASANSSDPFIYYSSLRWVRNQYLYLAEDLQSQDKQITALSLKFPGTLPGDVGRFKIRLANIDIDAFPVDPSSSSRADFINTGLVTVYDSDEPIDTVDPYGWYQFDLNSSFRYTASNNLLVDFIYELDPSNTSSSSITVAKEDKQIKRFIRLYGDSTVPGSPDDPNNQSGWVTYGTYCAVPHLKVEGAPAMEDALLSDFDFNCQVDAVDLQSLINVWLSSDGDGIYDPAMDISLQQDGHINLQDFAILASEWMEIYEMSSPPLLKSDFDSSGMVDEADMYQLISIWLSTAGDGFYDPAMDISPLQDGKIDLQDFVIFAGEWLAIN